MLQSVVQQAEGTQYSFVYNTNTTSTGCQQGTLASMTLPTGATASYAYQNYQVPVEACDQAHAYFTNVVGVASKTISGPTPNFPTAVWSFSLPAFDAMNDDVLCPHTALNGTVTYVCHQAPPDQAMMTVTDPLGNVSQNFYSVWPGSSGLYDPNSCQLIQGDGTISEHGVHLYEFGLPYTWQSSSSGGFLLSTRTYTPAGYTANLPARVSYVTYDQDLDSNGQSDLNLCAPNGPTCPSANRRISGERVINFDSSGQSGQQIDTSDTTRSYFDGLGHYRQAVLSGTVTNNGNTVPASGGATTFTAWNQLDNNVNVAGDGSIDSGTYPGSFVLPDPSQPWVLNTLSSISHTEAGNTAIEQQCYDPLTGFLRASRVLKQRYESPQDATDFVTLRTQTGGNVTRETFFGGDVSQTAPTNMALCAFANSNPSNSEFGISHTYTTGVLATSQYDNASFKSLDLTIDPFTGLTTRSRSTDGLTTTFTYDTAWRLISVQPPALAPTTYTYTNASGSGSSFVPASVEERTVSSQAGTVDHVYQYDALGRLWREKKLMPDGTTALRETIRNADGWTLSVSEWQTIPSGVNEFSFFPSHLTGWSSYDPFGRASTIMRPDGTTTTLSYSGVSSLSRTATVALSGGDGTVTAKETYDRQGRLTSVSEADAVNPPATASYLYDVGGRLTLVSMPNEDGTQTQTRSFVYDNRGLLQNETHPELGQSGYGSTTYANYDSRGHAHRRTTGSFDLGFDFDSAERITRVYPFGGGTSLKQFVYDDPNGTIYPQCAGGICNGKLIASTRWNEFPDAANLQRVDEVFQYDTSTGLTTQSDRTVWLTGDAFRTQQTYDDLGLPGSFTYPCHLSGGVCSDTPRVVSNGYTNGSLTSVGTWATGISYQANGLVATVTHGNGATETWTPDPNGMARPCSIINAAAGSSIGASSDPCGFTLSGNGWTSGDYQYDGAGNVKQMGTTAFSYDEQNRLRSWTTTNGAGGFGSTFVGLDAWGNRLFTAVKGCAGIAAGCYVSSIIPAQISGTTNHYAGVTYDDAGSVTNDGRAFAYDPLGMMTSASVSGRQFQYLYTADDERIGIVEVTNPASPAYTWTVRGFGNQLLRTYTGATSSMTWGEDEVWRGGVLLANERPVVGTRHYALDHLGSPRSVTSSSGTVLGQQIFQPFGAGGTTDGGALQFTGQERDMDLFGSGTANLPDYFHARYYDVQGRFLSVDRHSGEPRRLQSWNRYAYASNNPINRIDPDGLTDFYVTTTFSHSDFHDDRVTDYLNYNATNFNIANGSATASNFQLGLNDPEGVSIYFGHSNTTDSLFFNNVGFVPFSNFSNRNPVACISACNATAIIKDAKVGPGQALVGVTSNMKAGFVKAGDLSYVSTQLIAGLKAGKSVGQVIDGLNKYFADRAKKDPSYKVQLTIKGDRDIVVK